MIDERAVTRDTTDIVEVFMRDEMFHSLVYLYEKERPDLLKTTGDVFKKFLQNCARKSVNVHMKHASKQEWDSYLTRLWERAVSMKRIHRVFNNRRSNQYGAMKQKLSGTYEVQNTTKNHTSVL